MGSVVDGHGTCTFGYVLTPHYFVREIHGAVYLVVRAGFPRRLLPRLPTLFNHNYGEAWPGTVSARARSTLIRWLLVLFSLAVGQSPATKLPRPLV